MPLPEDLPTAEEIELTLLKAAEAHKKGRKAFDQALDEMFPEKPAPPSKGWCWRLGKRQRCILL